MSLFIEISASNEIPFFYLKGWPFLTVMGKSNSSVENNTGPKKPLLFFFRGEYFRNALEQRVPKALELFQGQIKWPLERL